MHWKVGLVALVFVGTAAAQGIGVPTVPGVDQPLPDPTITLPVIPGAGDPGAPTGAPGEGLPGAEPLVADPSHPAFNIPAASSAPGAPLLEYQHAIWRDGEHLGGVPRDGYDLIELRAWEVDEFEVGAGVLMRLEVAGNALDAESQYVIEGRLVVVEPEAPVSVLLWTEDGETWQSDDIIITQQRTERPLVPGLPAIDHHVIHVLVTYASLGADVGETLRDWRFSSFTDAEDGVMLTDVAPGGYWLTPDVELPEPNASGEFDDESMSTTASEPPMLLLRGAGQHIGIEGEWTQGIATMTLFNPYLETAQFVAMAYPADATPVNGTNGTIAPNSTLTFQFALPQLATAQTVQWDVRTDVGGVAQVQVTIPARPPPPAPAPEPEPEPEPEVVPLERTDPVVSPPTPALTATPSPQATPTGGEDSPGLGPVLLVALLAAVFWARRKD